MAVPVTLRLIMLTGKIIRAATWFLVNLADRAIAATNTHELSDPAVSQLVTSMTMPRTFFTYEFVIMQSTRVAFVPMLPCFHRARPRI